MSREHTSTSVRSWTGSARQRKPAAEASKNSGTKVTPEVLAEEWFIKHAKVHLNPGSEYGTGGEGHLRRNLATTRRNIKLALDSMTNSLKNL